MLDVFKYAPAAPLDATEEADLIAQAQAGDSDAVLRLIQAYGPVLRSLVAKFTRRGSDEEMGTASFSVEDAQQAALLGVMECINTHDAAKNPRLAGRVTDLVTQALAEETESRPVFQVPARSLSRFLGICRAADGDMVAAREAAPSHEMTVQTFDAIHASLAASSLEAISTADDDQPIDVAAISLFTTDEPATDVGDRILAQAAISAVEGEERSVVEMRYGFAPVVEEIDGVNVPLLHLPSDREIGGALGLTRPTVQRRGKSALGKMRHALGLVNKPAEAPAPFQLSQAERTAILRRDDYTCQICLFPVRISGDSTRYDAPEIDHIREQRHFKAGEEAQRDASENLRLAHRVCNNDRNRGLSDADICRKNTGLFT